MDILAWSATVRQSSTVLPAAHAWPFCTCMRPAPYWTQSTQLMLLYCCGCQPLPDCDSQPFLLILQNYKSVTQTPKIFRLLASRYCAAWPAVPKAITSLCQRRRPGDPRRKSGLCLQARTPWKRSCSTCTSCWASTASASPSPPHKPCRASQILTGKSGLQGLSALDYSHS